MLAYLLLGAWPIFNNLQSFWEAVILGCLCVWISVIDLDRFEIPDLASLLLASSGLVCHLALSPWLFQEALVTGAFWSMLFFLISLCYKNLRGFDGLGFGDVKLIFGIGVWLGFSQTLFVVLASAMSGIFTILVIAVLRRHRPVRIGTHGVAFGPFLCLCAWCVWLQGDTF